MMAERSSSSHDRDKYNSVEVERYAAKFKQDPMYVAFLFPAVEQYLTAQAKGKKVLDIGCGTGKWVKYASECGARSVDGFDISAEMVELSKQTTAGLDNVKVCEGDAVNMPYGDNTFDLALSIFVTCTLPLEAFIKHFKELYRVLAPGGKAVVVSTAKSSTFFNADADQVSLEARIQSTLASLPKPHTNEQINKAFADLNDVIRVTFALDENGSLYRVTKVRQPPNGHPVWAKTQIMTFPDYYYTDEFLHDQIKAAGLHIDQIESHCTEERRIAYNKINQNNKLEKVITDNPPHFLCHLSKPKL